MKCSNCGKTVRSKTKCAFCGHLFNGADSNQVHAKKEEIKIEDTNSEEVDQYIEDSEIIPKTKRKSNLLAVIWGIIKIAVVIFLVFLAIAFGPKYTKELWNRFGNGQNNVPEVTEMTEMTSIEETTVEETTEVSSVLNSSVTSDKFPLTEVVIELNSSIEIVERGALTVGIKSNNEEKEISDYSLLQEGNKLIIRFNNPTLAVVAAEQPEQSVFVRSSTLGINVELPITLPKLSVDAEKYEQFNTILTNNLAEQGSLSVAVRVLDEEVSYLYAEQSIDSSQLFSWFVLNRTLAAVKSGDLSLDSTVTVLDALKAANDQGEVASAEENTEYTVEELISKTIAQDVTAMNHLIQATGGPNNFNLWLTENQYFATKVNELLGTNDEGHLSGTVTSVQDVLTLMAKLANNELVSEELDTQLKEWLLGTPVTDKYPTNVDNIVRRYEIAAADADSTTQAYSAIVVTDNKIYLIVTTVNNINNPSEAVTAIAKTVRELLTYFETGKLVSEEDTEDNPEEVIEEEQVTTSETVETSVSGYQYGDDTDGDGFANSIYDEALGAYRAVRWIQGSDGLYYFEYVE